MTTFAIINSYLADLDDTDLDSVRRHAQGLSELAKKRQVAVDSAILTRCMDCGAAIKEHVTALCDVCWSRRNSMCERCGERAAHFDLGGLCTKCSDRDPHGAQGDPATGLYPHETRGAINSSTVPPSGSAISPVRDEGGRSLVYPTPPSDQPVPSSSPEADHAPVTAPPGDKAAPSGTRVAVWLTHGGLKAGTVVGEDRGRPLVQLDGAGKVAAEKWIELPGEWS